MTDYRVTKLPVENGSDPKNASIHQAAGDGVPDVDREGDDLLRHLHSGVRISAFIEVDLQSGDAREDRAGRTTENTIFTLQHTGFVHRYRGANIAVRVRDCAESSVKIEVIVLWPESQLVFTVSIPDGPELCLIKPDEKLQPSFLRLKVPYFAVVGDCLWGQIDEMTLVQAPKQETFLPAMGELFPLG